MLPWLPILGVIIALLLMISFGLSLSLCLYRGRKAHLPIDKPGKSENTICQLKYTGPDGTYLPLSEGDLGNDNRVLNWLSTVIINLDSNVVQDRTELRRSLAEIRSNLSTQHLVALDGDESSDVEKPLAAVILAHLDNILA